jgi:rhamnosyltransferase
VLNVKEARMNSDTDYDEIKVTILIRTKNEEKFIGQTLDILYSQTYKNIEVLIVDSGSTDKTLQIVRKYPIIIYEIKPEEFTWGYALNYGFQRAKGLYIICLSAHSLPLSVDWLEIMISNFKDENVAAVMSNTLPWPDCNPFDRRGLLKKFNMHKKELKPGPPFVFGNVSSAIRREVWEKIQFDETLSYCEDDDWMRKAIKMNYKVIYEPEAKVYHSHNETLTQIYSRTYQFAFAVQDLKYQRFTLPNVLYDFFVGSVYDMAYVLFKRDNIKWFFVAPLRRFAMNLAKYKSSNDIKANTNNK